jgi:hypothetical protein
MFRTQIHSHQFIVVSVDPSGNFSLSKRPRIHGSYAEALHESQRLASLNVGYRFLVLAVSAVSQVRAPVQNPVVTTYSL